MAVLVLPLDDRSSPADAPLLPFVHPIQSRHLPIVEVKIKHIRVLLDPRFALRLGQGDEAFLERPADEDLSGRSGDRFGDRDERRVVEILSASNRTARSRGEKVISWQLCEQSGRRRKKSPIGLDQDVLGPAELDDIPELASGVHLQRAYRRSRLSSVSAFQETLRCMA